MIGIELTGEVSRNYMLNWDNKFRRKLKVLGIHLDIYKRYIDDIFFLWTGSEEDLKKFLKTVNELHPSIKFDYAYSRSKSIFLDCSVTIKDKKTGVEELLWQVLDPLSYSTLIWK